MFTRQHYKAIAEIVKNAKERDFWSSFRVQALARIAYDLADCFGKDNPRFDRQKFFDACGI